MYLEYFEVLHALGVLRVKALRCIPYAGRNRGLTVRFPDPDVTKVAVEARRMIDFFHERYVIIKVIKLERL